MRQILRGLIVLAVALAAAACDGTSADPPSGAALATADRDIAAQLYAGTPRTPAGFVADPFPPSFSQVTTYHLKTDDLAAPAATSYELCTDDWNEALAWSEEAAALAPVYLDLVSNETTTRYFEFDRVPSGMPDQYVRMRVYRCDYLDRAGVNLSQPTAFAGTFNQRPLDAAALRDLSEYLWLFTLYDNAGHAVIASDGAAATSGLAHAITIASLETGVTPAGCDRITLREWRHTVDAISGALALATSTLRELLVRREGAAIVGC